MFGGLAWNVSGTLVPYVSEKSYQGPSLKVANLTTSSRPSHSDPPSTQPAPEWLVQAAHISLHIALLKTRSMSPVLQAQVLNMAHEAPTPLAHSLPSLIGL